MSDRIYIRDLAMRCVIGVYPEERRARQDVIVNVALECDFRRAARTDDIADTIDYKAIKREIIEHVEASGYNLIEAMADHVAALCLRHHGVRRATVTVDKPGALRFARSVAVEVTRAARPPRRVLGKNR